MRRVGVLNSVLTAGLLLAGSFAISTDAGAQSTRANPPAPRSGPSSGAAAPAAAKPSAPDHWDLNLKSEPPGAEAKVPSGQSCKTPCALNLPQTDTSVTFTLPGYNPQTIPVKWFPAMFHYEMYERTDQGIAVYPVDFSPNPAVAQMQPNGQPKTAAAAKPAPKKKPAAAAPAAEAPPQ